MGSKREPIGYIDRGEIQILSSAIFSLFGGTLTCDTCISCLRNRIPLSVLNRYEPESVRMKVPLLISFDFSTCSNSFCRGIKMLSKDWVHVKSNAINLAPWSCKLVDCVEDNSENKTGNSNPRGPRDGAMLDSDTDVAARVLRYPSSSVTNDSCFSAWKKMLYE